MKAEKASGGSYEMAPDMTPMIDVTFQLIIFFMVVSELNRMQQEAKLTLPVAVQGFVEENPNKLRLIINVEQDGTIKIYGQIFNQAQLRRHLQVQHKLLKDLERQANLEGAAQTAPIVLRADRLCKFENIRGILRVIQEAGFERLQFAAYTDPSVVPRAAP